MADASGQAAFDATPGISGIKHLLTDSMVAEGDAPSVDVAVTTLADVLEDQEIDVVDSVKSDVEGFDLSVLRGASSLLAESRIGLFQFEYNHCWISTRSLLRDVFELVDGLPYHVCKVVPGGIDAYDPVRTTVRGLQLGEKRDDRFDRAVVRVAFRDPFDE